MQAEVKKRHVNFPDEFTSEVSIKFLLFVQF